jgi:nitroreductase
MNDTLNTIYQLRSIHGDFSEKEVSDDELQIILDASVRAANASARQSYSIIAITDRQVISKQFSYNGSKALLFCVDYNRIIDTAAYLGKEFIMSGIHSFITGSTDTILAAQTAAIAAKSLGIDSLFTNAVHRCNMNNLYSAFQLPNKYIFPLIALILGYPQKEPLHKKGRITDLGAIHYNEYKRLSTDDLASLVDSYDSYENHLGLIDNWESLGFKHYLDWFYSVWSTGEPECRQAELWETIKLAGFCS